jgi:hypothetical protein
MLISIPELSAPLPDSLKETASLHDRIEAALASAEFLFPYISDPGVDDEGESVPTALEQVENRLALHEHAQGLPVDIPKTRPAVEHLKAMLDEYDELAATSAAQIRNYVTNKLLEDSTCNDPKVRIKALELLGKIGDVALFAERSVVTVQHKTSLELEQNIKSRLARIASLRAGAAEDAIPKSTAELFELVPEHVNV